MREYRDVPSAQFGLKSPVSIFSFTKDSGSNYGMVHQPQCFVTNSNSFTSNDSTSPSKGFGVYLSESSSPRGTSRSNTYLEVT